MSTDKIHIDNYESFYLDYLEGNLGENETLELFAFLNEHPELQVEDDMLVLKDETISLDQDFKNLLKTDIADEVISLNNIDYFLIAQKEGQLDKAQLEALSTFIAEHPQFKKDQKMYALSTLEADTSIVYADKKDLKHRAPIVLWPYFSAMAAASVVLFFWFMSPNSSDLDAVSAAREMNYKIKNTPNTQVAEGNELIPADDFNTVMPNDSGKTTTWVKQNNIKKITPQKQNVNVANNVEPVLIKKKEKPTVLKAIDDQKLDEHISIALNPDAGDVKKNSTINGSNSDYSLAMKDVARPVTRKLSEIIKSEVKMKKGTNADGKREGVLFKLGNFEFYRNRKIKP